MSNVQQPGMPQEMQAAYMQQAQQYHQQQQLYSQLQKQQMQQAQQQPQQPPAQPPFPSVGELVHGGSSNASTGSGGKQKKVSITKDRLKALGVSVPHMPKRPQSAKMQYAKDHREAFKVAHPGTGNPELTTILKNAYDALSEEEKETLEQQSQSHISSIALSRDACRLIVLACGESDRLTRRWMYLCVASHMSASLVSAQPRRRVSGI
jgi:hypothetical protein